MLETEQARAAIGSQEKRRDELNAEMKAKDDIVAKSQADIKRRNVEIKRKQADCYVVYAIDTAFA